MGKIIVSIPEAAKCLTLLEQAENPMVGALIAKQIGYHGSRETQRRRIRAVIKHLRDNGSRIIATLSEGYWLTEDEDVWRDYLEGRSIDAKRIFAEVHRRRRMLAEARQMPLFGPPVLAGEGCR